MRFVGLLGIRSRQIMWEINSRIKFYLQCVSSYGKTVIYI